METKFGRYRILDEIGRGAMGVVYLAEDERLSRKVAIKTIRMIDAISESKRAEYMERFRREAVTAAKLNHPNIVTVYDFGEEEKIPYITMEYVEGKAVIEDIEAPESIPRDRVIEIVRQVADALDYAHRFGIVHRDIKPGNLIADAHGRVKVTDFGIARLPGSELTEVNTVLGSPSYMSPEQILGRPIDGRSDIFSLGVVLYYMLTKEKPFPGEDTISITRNILTVEPIPPSRVVQGLSRGFDTVVMKALSKEPEKRYQKAQELAADLARVEQLPGLEEPGGTTDRFRDHTPGEGSTSSRRRAAELAARGMGDENLRPNFTENFVKDYTSAIRRRVSVGQTSGPSRKYYGGRPNPRGTFILLFMSAIVFITSAVLFIVFLY